MLYRIKNFIVSLYYHVVRGMPKATQDVINIRYYTCIGCESYDSKNSQCLECGCNVSRKKEFLNKLAWKDQKCPLDKW